MLSRYLASGVSPGRGSYDQAAQAEFLLEQARKTLADFFGAPDPNRVIFASNATDALNLALFGFLNPGDRVVTTRLEHNSVLRPLHHLSETRGVSVTLVPFDRQGYVDPNAVEKAIGHAGSGCGKPAALVVVTHASNVLGTVQPVARIGAICQELGVPLLVDASQSAGQVPVNMAAMGASAIAFTGHKSLYGPTGTGGLILHPGLEIRSTRFGGTGRESKSLVHTQTFPHRLEAGTVNFMGILGLSLSVDHLRKQGLARIHQGEMALARRLYQGLKAIRGVSLYGGSALDPAAGSGPGVPPADAGKDGPCTEAPSPPCQVPLFSVNVRGVTPQDLGAILDGDFDIAVRSGLHCAPLVHRSLGTGEQGAVRFSLGMFNTRQEIDTTLEAMEAIARKLGKG
jgi:selenocysteine lyase/cysteine desulfurase